VDARLDDDQQLLVEMVTRLAADVAVTTTVEATSGARHGDGWAAIRDTGLLALPLPEAVGGGGAGLVEVVLVAEALGRSLNGAPFLGQGVLAPVLLHAAGASAEVLGAVASGVLRVVPATGADLVGIARSGSAGVAPDAADADAALVLDEAGAVRAVVPGPALEGATDLTRVVCAVAADAPAIDLGDLGRTIPPDRLEWVEAVGAVVVAADALGVVAAALDNAVAYAAERRQFGVPIGSFQAVQHLLADAAVLVETSRSCVWHAAWAADTLEPVAAVEAARQAKAYVAEAARTVLETSLQVLGGIAFTWEELAHIRLRRGLFDRVWFGDEAHHLARIAEVRLGVTA
jgi:alkylation response protein AidB-like acyl-CoA dehydrogenase